VAYEEAAGSTSDQEHRELESLRAELELARIRLVEAEKLASLGEMAAGIAHEIRNPLDLVNNFAVLNEELLLELEQSLQVGHELEELVEDLKRNASVIVHHARRADDLVGALMRRAGAGAGVHEMTDVNRFVEEFLRIAYRSRQALNDAFHCDVERHYDDNVGAMLINRPEMGRALLNVLINAFEAMDEAAARNSSHEPRITVTTHRLDGHVEIKVEDNGVGVPGDVLSRVFEPFFTTKEASAGAGLGLSVSYDIVTGGHEGSMRLDSVEGKGATVTIGLPIRQAPD